MSCNLQWALTKVVMVVVVVLAGGLQVLGCVLGLTVLRFVFLLFLLLIILESCDVGAAGDGGGTSVVGGPSINSNVAANPL